MRPEIRPEVRPEVGVMPDGDAANGAVDEGNAGAGPNGERGVVAPKGDTDDAGVVAAALVVEAMAVVVAAEEGDTSGEVREEVECFFEGGALRRIGGGAGF